MLVANEEFATEVENLYTKEEKLMNELEKLLILEAEVFAL